MSHQKFSLQVINDLLEDLTRLDGSSERLALRHRIEIMNIYKISQSLFNFLFAVWHRIFHTPLPLLYLIFSGYNYAV